MTALQLSQTQIFSYLRMGLVTGIVDKEALIAWADQQILHQPTPDDRIIELSLSGKRSYSAIIWLLREFQSAPDHDLALKALLARANLRLTQDPACAIDLVFGLRLLNEEEYLPRQEHEQIADLKSALAEYRQGVLTYADLHALLVSFLAQYDSYQTLLDNVP